MLVVALSLRLGDVAALLPALGLPWAWRLGQDFQYCPSGLAFNDVLFRTFRLGLMQACLLALALLLSSR